MRGHLEQRRPGVWRLRRSAGRGVDGVWKQRSATINAVGKRAAEKQATAILAQWDADDEAKAANVGTVSELLDDWLKFRAGEDESPATVHRRASIIDRIRADLGTMLLSELGVWDVDRWVSALAEPVPGRKPLAPATRHHYLRVLRAVLQQGWKWGRMPSNVAARARTPKVDHSDQAPHMPTVEAWGALIAATYPPVAPRDRSTLRTAILLAAATGCRRGELVGLRWSDVQGDRLTVRRSLVKVPGSGLLVRPTKSRQERTMTLPPFVVAALAAHRRWQYAQRPPTEAGGRAMPSPSQRHGGMSNFVADATLPDGPILAALHADPTGQTHHQPDWLSQEWERLTARVGMPWLHLHGLRHLHGTELQKAGVSLAGTSARLGHAQVSTTANFYLEADTATDRAAAGVLETVFGAILPATKEET